MKMNENLNRILKSTQKISEQMASFAKVADSVKAHSSFLKNFENSQKIASTLVNQPVFYGGGEMIPKVNYFENTNRIASTLINQHKLYGGGEAVDVIVNFQTSSDRLRASIDALNSVIKSNNNEFFHSSGRFNVGNLQALETLKTAQAVSERNLSAHTIKRDKLAERVTSFLHSNDFEFNIDDWDSLIDCNISYDVLHKYSISEGCFISDLAEFVRHEKEIEYENSKIEILKKLYKSAKRRFRKFALNKREFFRKINSFHFKNLDDYHSIASLA